MKVIEKTPAESFCAIGTCPSVFETDRGTYIIVGKEVIPDEITQKIKDKIGIGEMCIEVPKELITKLKS